MGPFALGWCWLSSGQNQLKKPMAVLWLFNDISVHNKKGYIYDWKEILVVPGDVTKFQVSYIAINWLILAMVNRRSPAQQTISLLIS
jgi:hypothetical protein